MKTLQERASTRPAGQGPIIETSVRILVPFIQLYGLYVIVHGHYSPGGGFQGGVALGASFILLGLAFDLPTTLERMSERSNALLANMGVLIYTGVGALCAILGGYLLDYSALTTIIPMEATQWRSLGIFLVEVGVGLAVMNIMVSLFWDIGSAGQMDEGL